MDILSKEDVIYGRADPNSDPCGYRTVLLWKLSEKFYNKPSFCDSLLLKDIRYIRPKAIDLIALLDAKALDYIFEYRSVAEQHNLKYIKLNDSINLSNPELSEFYNTVEVKIKGNKNNNYIKIRGESMIYGITLLKNADNKKTTKEFFNFVLSERGSQILKKNGQRTIK